MGKGRRSSNGEPTNLYQRNGVWYARATVGGRPYRESLQTSSRAEAERRLKPWLASRSPYHGTTRRTYDEAALLWLEAGNWKPKTTMGYAKIVSGVLNPHFQGMFWDQVDKAELQRFMLDRRKQGASPATINRALTVISGIANHVRDLPGWPEINPVTLLSRAPRKERRWTYIRPPASDVEAYFARTSGPFLDLCRVALECGARKDELVYLHRDHAMGGKATFLDTKSGLPRTVPWTPVAREIVDRQPIIKNSPYLFNSNRGTPYKTVTEMWRELRIRAQKMAQKNGRRLTPMRFHDLRHEYAIRYLETGGSLYTLQMLLGHGSIKQTERYLAYLTPDQQEKAKMGTSQI